MWCLRSLTFQCPLEHGQHSNQSVRKVRANAKEHIPRNTLPWLSPQSMYTVSYKDNCISTLQTTTYKPHICSQNPYQSALNPLPPQLSLHLDGEMVTAHSVEITLVVFIMELMVSVMPYLYCAPHRLLREMTE